MILGTYMPEKVQHSLKEYKKIQYSPKWIHVYSFSRAIITNYYKLGVA